MRDRTEQWAPLPLRCRKNCEDLTSQWRKQCGMHTWLPCGTMGKFGKIIKIMGNIASWWRKRMSFVDPHPQWNLICDGINKTRSDAFADYTALGWTKDPTNVGKNGTLHLLQVEMFSGAWEHTGMKFEGVRAYQDETGGSTDSTPWSDQSNRGTWCGHMMFKTCEQFESDWSSAPLAKGKTSGTWSLQEITSVGKKPAV